jgi:phospholipase/carboxylesterase
MQQIVFHDIVSPGDILPYQNRHCEEPEGRRGNPESAFWIASLALAMTSAYKIRMAQITNSYDYKPRSGNAPKQLVILLHGLGADGRDLMGLAPEFSQSLPDAVFVSPDAPFPCDMAPMGYQWFSLQDWTVESMTKGVKTAAPILKAFIDEQLKKYHVPASKLALVGFSQGTMMSLYVGPRYPERIAGVVGYSGALIGADDPENKIVHRIPVCLIHGEADTIVPVSARRMAQDVLEGMGFTISGHTTPGLPHGIDGKGVVTAASFLNSVLSA